MEDCNLHDSTKDTLNDLYKSHTERLYNEISFMEGRCLGLTEGNHFAYLKSGITTTQYLCEKLSCEYLGVASFVRLNFVYSTHSTSLDVFSYHGKGAAKKVGTSLKQVEDMADVAEADIYICGHDHKKSAAPGERLCLNGRDKLRLDYHKQLYIRSGSFLNAYEPDTPSYVVDALLTPASLGVVKIELTPKRTDDGGIEIDMHASV